MKVKHVHRQSVYYTPVFHNLHIVRIINVVCYCRLVIYVPIACIYRAVTLHVQHDIQSNSLCCEDRSIHSTTCRSHNLRSTYTRQLNRLIERYIFIQRNIGYIFLVVLRTAGMAWLKKKFHGAMEKLDLKEDKVSER